MSHVVIAITHCDQLPKNIRRKEQDRIYDGISKLYTKKGKVYPRIHAVEFVQCNERKNDFSDIHKLANVLCNVAREVEIISSNSVCICKYYLLVIVSLNAAYRANQKIKVINQKIPSGFAHLQQKLTGNRIANSDHFEQDAHVVTWSQLKYA